MSTTLGAIAVAFVVAVMVLAMVAFGGGLTRPLVAPAPHVTAVAAAAAPAQG